MPEKGFFPSLFDIGFTSLITPRVIKVLYVIGIVLIALFAVVITISAFANDPASGIFVLLIVAPLGALLYLIYWRVVLEFFIVLFRIMENTGAMAAQAGAMPAGGGLPAPAPGLGAGPQPGGLGAAPPPTAQPAAAPAPAQPAAPPAGGGPGQAAGWYPDPQGKARVRYWDGSSWTDHTAD